MALTRIALAGTGPWSDVWARTIGSERLHGRCSGRDGADVQAMLRDATHCIVANHPAGHEAVVMAALERGVPVLCEKPFALDLAAVKRMMDLEMQLRVGQAGRNRLVQKVFVSYPHLWSVRAEQMSNPDFPFVRGKIVFGGETGHDYPPLLDWGPHALSFAVALLGEDLEITEEKTIGIASGCGWAGTLESGCGALAVHIYGHGEKRVDVSLSYPVELSYGGRGGRGGDIIRKRPLRCMLDAFTEGNEQGMYRDSHWQFDPALTLRTHELLEEICQR